MSLQAGEDNFMTLTEIEEKAKFITSKTGKPVIEIFKKNGTQASIKRAK